ncbi:prepilin-type N-terminal cleavage/methylation domain-containing protein [Cryobacterium sinapicolor]|uniref:Prepilin-type N-terminal cleavage/methylation domain-containing protein n=1 Tax=Cryobacterium sinapicolor TaxID=1259236 RepID=A0ABY2JHE2_9MICO|nr:prepilin-type N-terminal cleavage/methylation domain-containing protein [Cryobacterium sp. TMT3-29-2]TFD04742.1 prepilin-type N-terminal cleavage/methylation domain-containing protein [Cryobacterium sinapicolor]
MKPLCSHLRLLGGRDPGLGLVEILVSMMILAILAVAVLPVLVQGLRTSGSNATLATASQFAGQELDLVRRYNSDCSTVSTFDDVPTRVAADARGVSLEIRRSVGACPAATAYPGVVRVSVEITRAGIPSPILAKATTFVLLEGAAP